MVVAGTFGFYPAPKGAKMPESPAYPTYNYGDSATLAKQQAEYNTKQQKYQDELKTYQNQQKTFIQNKVVPYARNVFVGWIAAIVLFEIVGLLFIKMSSSLVGSGFAFSGFFAVVFGPIGGLLFYVSWLVSSFSRGADQQFSSDPVFQAISVASLVGVVALAAVGYILELKNKPQFI